MPSTSSAFDRPRSAVIGAMNTENTSGLVPAVVKFASHVTATITHP